MDIYCQYDVNLFERWRKRSTKVTVMYVIMFGLVVITSMLNPFIFDTSRVSFKNADNSYNYYRLNVYSIHSPVSDELYNKYFIAF